MSYQIYHNYYIEENENYIVEYAKEDEYNDDEL